MVSHMCHTYIYIYPRKPWYLMSHIFMYIFKEIGYLMSYIISKKTTVSQMCHACTKSCMFTYHVNRTLWYNNYVFNIHSPKKVKDIIFLGYFLLNCNDKSRIIKNTPNKNNILNFFWGVYVNICRTLSYNMFSLFHMFWSAYVYV